MPTQFVAPTGAELLEWSLRFLHVLFGIAWIGMLYFFNLVNVPLMAKLDGPTKGKVIPVLMPKALWVFRWGAVGTWAFGFVYFALLCSNHGVSHAFLVLWLVLTLVAYAIVYFVLSPQAKLQKDGRVIAAILAVVTVLYCVAMRLLVGNSIPEAGQVPSRVLFIAYGGGLGTFMLLNVWGIIWRNQKKIIAWTAAAAEGGPPAPPEAAALGRHAFLASRTNAWLSLPMLAFMILAGHGKVFFH